MPFIQVLLYLDIEYELSKKKLIFFLMIGGNKIMYDFIKEKF